MRMLIAPLYRAAEVHNIPVVQNMIANAKNKGLTAHEDELWLEISRGAFAFAHNTIPKSDQVLLQRTSEQDVREIYQRINSVKKLYPTIPDFMSYFESYAEPIVNSLPHNHDFCDLDDDSKEAARAVEVLLIRAFESLQATRILAELENSNALLMVGVAVEEILAGRFYKHHPDLVREHHINSRLKTLKLLTDLEELFSKDSPSSASEFNQMAQALRDQLSEHGVKFDGVELVTKKPPQRGWRDYVFDVPFEGDSDTTHSDESLHMRYAGLFLRRDELAHSLPTVWDTYITIDDSALQRSQESLLDISMLDALTAWNEFFRLLADVRDEVWAGYWDWGTLMTTLYHPLTEGEASE